MEKVTRISTLSTRRPKWQYPPAPTPRILHLPRRQYRKKQPPSQQQQQKKSSASKRLSSVEERRGKLEELFDQERVFARGGRPIVMVNEEIKEEEERRRERVEEEEEERDSVVVEEQKWRFQAEMLRAECNLLRMEREIAVKKLERRKVQMERALRSAVQILVSGRQRIHDDKTVGTALDEDILEMIKKMERLQRRITAKDVEVRNSSNLDRQVSILRRRLDKFGGKSNETRVKEIQEMAEASLSIRTTCPESFASNGSCNMEILRREMEKLSKGTFLERIKDEYGSMLSTANSSAASSASTSKRIDFVDTLPTSAEIRPPDKKGCPGCCKAIVKKVVEQVRAETEQWSQMQEMLRQIRDEMEELQASREYWEDRALDSDCQLKCLRSSVEEWRRKAINSESRANELHSQVFMLHEELERLKKKKNAKNPIVSRNTPSEMEKRVLVCQLKENRRPANDYGSKQKEVFSEARRKALSCNNKLDTTNRAPFRDIGNLSPFTKQNSRLSFSLHRPMSSGV